MRLHVFKIAFLAWCVYGWSQYVCDIWLSWDLKVFDWWHRRQWLLDLFVSKLISFSSFLQVRDITATGFMLYYRAYRFRKPWGLPKRRKLGTKTEVKRVELASWKLELLSFLSESCLFSWDYRILVLVIWWQKHRLRWSKMIHWNWTIFWSIKISIPIRVKKFGIVSTEILIYWH